MAQDLGPPLTMPARMLLLLIAALLAPAGCRLVDQRTFERASTAPASAQLARPDLPKLPLVTIAFTVPDADWRPAVRSAVDAAQARKRDVTFSVVTPVPTSASREVQDGFIKQGQADATLVAQEIHLDGIAPDKIAIGLRGDPGAPPREVRIYAE